MCNKVVVSGYRFLICDREFKIKVWIKLKVKMVKIKEAWLNFWIVKVVVSGYRYLIRDR